MDLTGVEDNNTTVSVKSTIYGSKAFKESLKSKAVNDLFTKPKDSKVRIVNVFENQYNGGKG